LPDFDVKTDLTTGELLRLTRALAKCKFDVNDARGSYVFERFGQLLTRLVQKERALVLTLLEDFLHCSSYDLMPLLRKALEAIPAAMLAGIGRVILLPLAETRNDGKPKSSSALLYPAENVILPYMPSFSGKQVSVYEKMALLREQADDRSDSLVILLDDFVGSGGSAVKAIQRYRSDFAKTSDRLVVAVVAAQEQGIKLIAQENVTTYVGIVRKRGISDSSVISDRKAALAIMDSLEGRLGVAADYLRGYGKCEALVTMLRTPNNTFPIFWYPTTPSGERWPAPFRRFA